MPNEDTLYSAKHWAAKAKEYAEQASQGQIQVDWNQSDNTKKDFIKNKPTKLSDFTDDTASNPVSRATADASGNNIANTYATKTELNQKSSFKLFHHDWFDYQLNDQSWLRADTFSWQDGTVYSEAYNHLVDDYNGLDVTYYAWATSSGNPEYVYTKSKIPAVGDSVYLKSAQNFFVVATTIVSIDNLGTDIYDISCSNSEFDAERFGDEYAAENVTISGQPSTETVGSYTITYYQAQDGHKICLPDQETTVQNIYNESGVAWYYILDTANQRFKLPRENPAREQLIQVIRAKGNGNTLGLTDGTTNAGLTQPQISGGSTVLIAVTQAYGQPVGTYTGNTALTPPKNMGITTDPTKSGIISDMTDSTSVFKGKKYLYFYVGQFTQTATEQTAGLNAELFNGKMDRDMSNMNASQTAKETIVGWGVPDYSSGISTTITTTTTYTAPSIGLVVFADNNNSTQNGLIINDVDIQNKGKLYCDGQYVVSKGDIVKARAGSIVVEFFPLKGAQNA